MQASFLELPAKHPENSLHEFDDSCSDRSIAALNGPRTLRDRFDPASMKDYHP